MNIVILAGGLSHERDVSMRSGRRVAESLRDRNIPVTVSDVDAKLLGQWEIEAPTVVIPLLHGTNGEDGSLRDVLEALQINYVGSRPDACRIAFDKPIAKAVAHAAGIRTPQSVALPHSTFRELGADAVIKAVAAKVGLPAIVKPTKSGSSLGATVVRDIRELPAALVAAFAYGDIALVEQFISGTEIAVSVIERNGVAEALPAVEIVPDGGFYDYAARYTAGSTEFFAPARLSDALASAAAKVAVDAHRALGLRDLSRSDLIVDANGDIWFLEVNVAPGMTETSLFPLAVEAAGLGLGDVMQTLVETAARRTVTT